MCEFQNLSPWLARREESENTVETDLHTMNGSDSLNKYSTTMRSNMNRHLVKGGSGYVTLLPMQNARAESSSNLLDQVRRGRVRTCSW